jgi:choline dehydrogenase-like flavoprotein
MTELEAHASLRTEVAVVGAGLAGIDVARYLGERGVRVVLLESGRLEFDPAIQELARVSCVGKQLRTPESDGDMSPYLPPMYRGYCRVRKFGGTTNVWTGKWRIFDPWDFEHRPWIPHSGWPIALEDLLPYYRETADDYGFGDFDGEASSEAFRNACTYLAPHGLAPHLYYWEKTPTRSGSRFFQDLKRSARVDVLLGATATEMFLDDRKRTVRSIRCRSLDNRSITLLADRFVLATGGLEAPRLLLASNGQLPAGIGNEHGLVGRFYMDHPKSKQSKLKPGPALERFLEGVKTQPRPRFGMSFGLSGAEQKAQGLPNHALYVRADLRTRSWTGTRFGVKIGFEPMPNRESRVYLGSRLDALGMPELVVDWRFTTEDHANFDKLQRSLSAAFLRAGLGRLDFRSKPLSLEDMTDASHHMGTTRMATDPSEGVVDRNCRVFDTENLYIASSSVFPTAHGYSPTYTILALARRLGHHLAGARQI